MTAYPEPSGEHLELGAAEVDPAAEEVFVRMADGVSLATDVYLPEGPRRELSTVLIRHCYDKAGRPAYTPQLAHYLTAHGFAVVVQDVRGKFRSEGAPRLPFAHEAEDGYETLDWIQQQPWSNSAAGMYGDSYYGSTQLAAASTGHPALRAIVPGVTGQFWFNGFHPERVPELSRFDWAIQTFGTNGLFFGAFLTAQEPLCGVLAGLPDEVAEIRGYIEQMVRLCASRGMERVVYPSGSPVGRVAVPALHTGGWFDTLQDFQIDDWQTAAKAALPDQFLRMDASDHLRAIFRPDYAAQPSHESDDETLYERLPRFLDEPIRFFDHYLNGRRGPWVAPRVRVNTVFHGYEFFDRWPPTMAASRSLHLTAGAQALEGGDGGGLSAAPDSERQVVRWIHHPSDPVPHLVRSEAACVHLGFPDEQELHSRDDVATFTTEASTEPLDLLGPITAHLKLDADAPSTFAVVRLLDVAPDGSARFVRRGASRVDTSGAEPTTVAVRLGDIAYRLRPGHRFRLAISTSSFPYLVIHPGTDDDPLYATQGRDAEQLLEVGGGGGSWLDITIRD